MIVAVLEVEVKGQGSIVTYVAVFRIWKVLRIGLLREVVLVEGFCLAIRQNFFLSKLVHRYCQLVLDLPLQAQHSVIVLLLRQRDLFVLVPVSVVNLTKLFNDIHKERLSVDSTLFRVTIVA